jgi:hypothetical protein
MIIIIIIIIKTTVLINHAELAFDINKRTCENCKTVPVSTFKQEVLGRINRLLSFEAKRTAKKTMPPTILRCRMNAVTELCYFYEPFLAHTSHNLVWFSATALVTWLIRRSGSSLPVLSCSECHSKPAGFHNLPLPASHHVEVVGFSL